MIKKHPLKSRKNIMRHYNTQDKHIMQLDILLNSVMSLVAPRTQQPIPGCHEPDAELNTRERHDVIGMMRVNHSGEVCAQALYSGQALVAKNVEVQNTLRRAGTEEEEHLHWTSHRLQALGGHTSLLNPIWYLGSLSLGIVAGLSGDRWSLGFVDETEKQVEAHLEGHLARLPSHDTQSRAIIDQMRLDEIRHAENAREAGAAELPQPIKWGMRMAAKVMTTLASRI
jgi:3-demethoxyubiquinol 3-hydroxylase